MFSAVRRSRKYISHRVQRTLATHLHVVFLRFPQYTPDLDPANAISHSAPRPPAFNYVVFPRFPKYSAVMVLNSRKPADAAWAVDHRKTGRRSPPADRNIPVPVRAHP
jgi:hypothetical protein